MTKRYGRNQKRAHRARIAELEIQLRHACLAAQASDIRAARAERALHDAKSRALSEWLNSEEEIRHTVEMMTRELARHLAPELAAPAAKVLASTRRRTQVPISFHATPVIERQVTVLRGKIPALCYAVHILN